MSERPTKVVGRRVVAWLIDLAINLTAFVLLLQSFGTEYATTFDPPTSGLVANVAFGDTQWVATGGDAGVVFLGVLAVGLLNSVLLTGVSGGSVGKHVLGLRVVRADGQPAGPGKCALRWLLLVVDAFPYFVPIVGFVMALSAPNGQRLGDRVAGTYVVGKEHMGRPLDLVGAAATAHVPTGYPGQPPTSWAQPVPGPAHSVPAGEPQWDAARGTWIRWDGRQWLAHDRASDTWTLLR